MTFTFGGFCKPLFYWLLLGQTLVTGAIGAIAGAIVGAGIETARQAIFDDEFDPKKIGGAAVQGAIFGGVAGLTGGVSLAYQIPALAAANAVGGVANRAISNDPTRQPLNGASIGIDFVAGGVGGYFAPLGTSRYLAATAVQRDASAAAVETLLVSSPVPGMLPTLTRPVVQTAIRNEIYHGYAQNISNGIVRGGTRTATAGTLNFLWNFNIARTVQSSGNNSSKNKKSKDTSSPSGATCTTVDGGGGKKGKATMCGPFFID